MIPESIPVQSPLRVDLRMAPAIKLHFLVTLLSQFGGAISSRLISEEDVEINWPIGPLSAPVEITSRLGTVVVQSGSSFNIRDWMHLVDHAHPMPSDIMERFLCRRSPEQGGAP